MRHWVNGLLLMLLIVTGAAILWQASAATVTRVVVVAPLRELDEQQVRTVLQPLLAQPVWQLSLSEVEQNLHQLPWIAEVQLQRLWPSTLKVTLRERDAIARWGKEQLIDSRGQVFSPTTVRYPQAWPQLQGPVGTQSQVLERYRQLNERLAPESLSVEALRLSALGGWQVRLSGGVLLELGDVHLQRRLERFITVYRQQLVAQFTQIATIDARYTNGLAVAWRDPSAHHESKEA